MSPWAYLALAIVSEVIGTVALRESDGFSKLGPGAIVVVAYALSFWLLALTLRELDLSLVYAIWAGIGTALIAVIGIAAFDEPADALKLASLALIVAGIVGLNLAGSH